MGTSEESVHVRSGTLTCFQQLLSRKDNLLELVDGGPELFLEIADAGGRDEPGIWVERE